MPVYEYSCRSCECVTQEVHGMRDFPRTSKCEKCGAVSDKIISAPSVVVHTDLLKDGKPRYISQLARRMPKGKPDPRAFYTHKSKAQDAARRKADSTEGMTFTKDS